MKKVLRVIGFLFVGLYVVAHYFPDADVPAAAEVDESDFDQIDTLESEIILTHNRAWRDLDDQQRKLAFSFSATEDRASGTYRDNMQVERGGSERAFWRDLYYHLYKHDQEYLLPLQDSIRALARRESIVGSELMHTIVSMVQDIRYNYIISVDSCYRHTDFPCVPNQRFGILSPVEFLYTLSGDCDTRTVLLFSLLKDLGFDPVIVNSSKYLHSMLAVDIPSGGDYVLHKGRKFYFWETTSTGWQPGMIPPGMNDTNYWTVALDYEYETDAFGHH